MTTTRKRESTTSTPAGTARKAKLERRGEIAHAALRLLGSYGLSGMTVSRIAKAVGLTKGSLYHHYANREDMLWAALELMSDIASEHVTQSSGANGLERLETVGVTHGKWAASHMDTFVRPIYHLLAGARQARLQATLAVGMRQKYAMYLAIVQAGQEDGSIRQDVDPADIAWVLLMFHWAEDVALLQGVAPDVITSGVSARNLRRLLSVYATHPPVGEDENAPSDQAFESLK